jgi:16S rRNA (guanine527-N7)-methyltransferase
MLPKSTQEFELQLSDGLDAIGVGLDEDWLRALEIHARLLEKWSQKINLISTSDETGIIARHLIDSLALLRLRCVRDCLGPAVDVGSGAGFPGIPLAIACPEACWTLLEPRQRRGAFLTQVLAEARISNASWSQGRVPAPQMHGQYELAVSRATFSPDQMIDRAGALLKAGGSLILMAARNLGFDPPDGWAMTEENCFEINGAPRWIASVVRHD